MSNSNHKHAARLIARERGINYTTALRLVREEGAQPAAWTYTYNQPSRAHSAAQVVPDQGSTPPRSGASLPDGLVFEGFFETTADVLVAIARQPERLPYFAPESSTVWEHTFHARDWTPEHLDRYPLLEGVDDSLVRQRVVLYEPYAELRWIAARADSSLRPLPEDQRTFNFPGREALYEDLTEPIYLTPEVIALRSPPDVPKNIESAFWEQDMMDLEEAIEPLCLFLLDWPTSIAGWLLLGRLHWAYAHEDGWSVPISEVEKTVAHEVARMAWETGVAIAETAIDSSTLPPGFCTPAGGRLGENEPFLHCLNALVHLYWADGELDRATDTGRNLLVLDAKDLMQYRKMRPLHDRDPYPWNHDDNHGPAAMWGPQVDDFEYEAIIARHPPGHLLPND